MPGLLGSPKIAPVLISSASRRTNPSGTGCLYWPDADTDSSIAPITQPTHFIAFVRFIILSMAAANFANQNVCLGTRKSIPERGAGLRYRDRPLVLTWLRHESGLPPSLKLRRTGRRRTRAEHR